MTFLNKVTAEPNGNALNWIIYKLKNNHNIPNPIQSGYIIPSSIGSDSSYANIDNTIVDWSKSCWVSVDTNPNPFYQVYFPKNWIHITGYSLRSCHIGLCYPKKWKVYGFNEDNKNDQSKWDELGENISTSSQPYCYTTSGNCNTNYAVGTFTTKKTNNVYQYIRFVLTKSSCSSISRFILSGFDVFGTLSSTRLFMFPRKTICTCLRRRKNISSDVIVLIIGMSVIQS